jgi:hypothetical protein
MTSTGEDCEIWGRLSVIKDRLLQDGFTHMGTIALS